MKFSAIAYTADGSLRAPWRVGFFVTALVFVSLLATLLLAPIVQKLYVVAGIQSTTFSSIIDLATAFGATWLALRWVDKKPWREVGLDRAAARPAVVGAGFIIGGAAIALPIIALILAGWLRSVPGVALPWGHPILRVTMLLLPAALAEEVLTRGYLLTVLRDAWNWPVAVAVTSVLFGLLHLRNAGANAQSVALVTLAGVFLATVRIATGSLYAAWAAHFAWNWVMAALFHAPVSGYAFDAPGYRYVDAGPDWATGGVWGPEGGIPAGLAMIGGTGLLLLRWRRRPSSLRSSG